MKKKTDDDIGFDEQGQPFTYWILNADGEPEPTTDFLLWGEWMARSRQDRSCVVAQDRDEAPGAPDVIVSTVFLGLDHNCGWKAPPALWETMILGGPRDGLQRRYTSRAAAVKGHQAICRLLQRDRRKGTR